MGFANLPPSRNSNPFATCWTRPGAIAYRFAEGESGELLVKRLAANGWCGEIVGPHGVGKSTLLETLQPLLAAAGRHVSSITLRDHQRHLPRGWLRHSLASSLPLILIDGYEQLSWPNRLWLRWRCRRASAGLLATSHTATGLPRLVELNPSRALADQLVATLTARIPSPVTPADVAAGYACHGSNLRELLFTLYDRHEVRCRAARTAVSRRA